MNKVDGKKIQSMLKNIAELLRRKRDTQQRPYYIIDLEEGNTVFSRSFYNLADPSDRNAAMTALLEAERQKAEAIELARRLLFR